MDFYSTALIYFSPTRSTRRVLREIAVGLGTTEVKELDLTLPDRDYSGVSLGSNRVTVIGSPVYGGRVPDLAAKRLKSLKAESAPAVLVAVYGNRAYEDALIELRDLAREAGFAPIAAGAFIAEHSFSSESAPIARGRPDGSDTAKARDFGIRVREKLEGLSFPKSTDCPQIPGNIPYKEKKPSAPVAPYTDMEKCNLCGVCAEVCPAAAVSVTDTVSTDGEKCILCSACINMCPEGARYFGEDAPVWKVVEMLRTKCRDRKEPEFFI